MLFPTATFAIFFMVVLPLSWLLMPHGERWRVFIIAASFVFYAGWDWRFSLPARVLDPLEPGLRPRDPLPAGTPRSRKWLLAGALTGNLALLGYFKYYDFFVTSTNNLFASLGIDVPLEARSIILPVGISFFTFMAISYVVDVYRGDFAPTGLGKFAAYLSFFPHLVAGPIVRPGELIPQLDSPRDPRYVDTSRAFFLIGTGLFMKVVIANYLASNIVDEVFGAPNQHSSLEVLVGIYAYAVQIYADFFGYTNIAIGLALLLGFRFPQNFDAPYAATSIQDFWRRWHMTLSRWLRDYVYIPLGGNRGGSLFTYRNLMLTMLIGGLWHGAGWTFVAWGAIHGTALVAERWWRERPGYVERPSTALASRLAALPHLPDRLLRLDLLPLRLLLGRLGGHRAPLHRVGRAVRARHRRSAARDRGRHRVAVPSAQASARAHGTLLASPGAGAGSRPLGRAPRHPRHGPGGRGPVHLLPVLMSPTRRRHPRRRVDEEGRRLHSAGLRDRRLAARAPRRRAPERAGAAEVGGDPAGGLEARRRSRR